jgi:hypothetical protein
VTTRLEGDLKREVLIGQQAYTLTISPNGFVLVLKGRRKGLEISWPDLVSGDAAMATALNASLSANIQPTPAERPTSAQPDVKVAKASKPKQEDRNPQRRVR